MNTKTQHTQDPDLLYRDCPPDWAAAHNAASRLARLLEYPEPGLATWSLATAKAYADLDCALLGQARASMAGYAPDLLEALKRCKAAVENTNLPPSARMELVRDFATPAIAKAKGGA